MHSISKAGHAAYELKLIGNLGPTYIGFVRDIVRFSATGPDGVTFGGELYRDDSVTFREHFSHEEWRLPNVVRFVAVGSLRESPRGEMLITNASGRLIRYMRVDAFDRFWFLTYIPMRA